MLLKFAAALFALFILTFGMGLIWQGSWATGLWHWQQPQWISNYILGTILVCYAIMLLWIVTTSQWKTLLGVCLSLAVMFAGWTYVYLREFGFGQILVYFLLASLWFSYAGSLDQKKHRKGEKVPLSCTILFGLVASLCFIEGMFLITPLPQLFAWLLTAQAAVALGWAFLGAALLFAWGVFDPIWENAYPRLYALLAFNLFIIGPYFNPPAWTPHNCAYKWAYLIFIIISTIWAAWLLLRHLLRPEKELTP